MIEYIQYKNLLLTQYEFSRGSGVTEKELKKRQKEITKGTAIIVDDIGNISNQTNKVSRK